MRRSTEERERLGLAPAPQRNEHRGSELQLGPRPVRSGRLLSWVAYGGSAAAMAGILRYLLG
ncbi:hypothetical protein Rhal01_03818 [Rubritalea halochordaticola]|uniref:Uncharacterized protein n=1 Tax=Rubritalea halochordaticola TaxID=714537 RepID=A0ABP9V4N4_9BACT